jgi:hypothetical protein
MQQGCELYNVQLQQPAGLRGGLQYITEKRVGESVSATEAAAC